MIDYKRTKVLVADDHYHFRKGIISTLSTMGINLSDINEAADGQEAVQLALSKHFDVIIMDVSMPVMNGFEASKEILAKKSISKILVVTMYDDDALIKNLLHIGVFGYLPKNLDADLLQTAIKALMNGGRFYHGTKVPDLKESSDAEPPYLNLTDREKKVISMLSQGQTNKEIASQQRMSVRSVESCRYRLMKKIGVRSTTELLKYTSRNGLVHASQKIS